MSEADEAKVALEIAMRIRRFARTLLGVKK